MSLESVTGGNVLRVAFFCPTAAPFFDRQQPGYTGGMEKRAWLFATGLSQAYPECRVAAVVRPAKGRLADWHRDIRLVPLPPRRPWVQRMADDTYRAVEFRSAGPFVKVNHWDASLWWKLPCRVLWGAWSAATRAQARSGPRVRSEFSCVPADVLIAFSANLESADAIASARRYGITSVLATASDSDLHMAAGRGVLADVEDAGAVARFCLENADHVIVQTERQRVLLHEGPAARDATVIRNPIRLSAGDVQAAEESRRRVLWVGRSDENIKRPALCLELARRLPQINFTMVMNREEANVYEKIVGGAPANVSIVDRVAPDAMPGYFAQSLALINTTPRDEEGFPNVFLEAAATGTVVVSLEADPDGLLSNGPLGICCQGDLDRMASVLGDLSQDRDKRRRLAEQAAEYVRNNHSLEMQVARLYEFLVTIATGPARQPVPREVRGTVSIGADPVH
jgi:glycosyltransferase involved in cell wall biosynthesis